jgi:2-polyprenyl-3-methyl-5-hydroxy-6-metoxy-1,4-benzoquinol methylase
MKNTLIKVLTVLKLYKKYTVPEFVKTNYSKAQESEVANFKLVVEQFCKPSNYSSELIRKIDIDALLNQRLNLFRSQHIPFLIETIGLEGKKVLEIGCGTGSSTLALAEQGALVTSIDIDTEAIEIAKKRLSAYGVVATFKALNALDLESQFEKESWDIVIFYASIEHMLPSERKSALSAANKVIKKNGHLCIFGTPNRLWPMDMHTSQLPFYMWIQDELALDYARFSARKEFAEISSHNLSSGYELLYRWGRGVSFHEIEVALESIKQIKVVGALPIFLRRYSFIQKISYKLSLEHKYKHAISQFGPKDIHPGFYEPYLDVIIEKNN